MIMTPMKRTPLALAAAAMMTLAITAAPTDAAIVKLNDTSGVVVALGPNTHTISFDAGASATKLIVTLSGETAGGPPAITYDNEALTPIPDTSNGRNHGIWYLDNPSTGGAFDLTIDMTAFSTVNGIGFGVVSISGAESGYAASAVNTDQSVDLNVPADGAFIVTNFGSQGIGGTATIPSGHEELYAADNIGSAEGAASYLENESAGLQTYAYSHGASDERTSAAAFVAIPTPAALPAGLALIGLAAARRRRR